MFGWCDGLMGLVDSPFWLLSESLVCVIDLFLNKSKLCLHITWSEINMIQYAKEFFFFLKSLDLFYFFNIRYENSD